MHLQSHTRDQISPKPVARGDHRQSTVDEVVYKIADCRCEVQAALRLVHEAYTKSGLMIPNKHAMRVTPYHALPSTGVFLAMHKTTLIYTMTLVADGTLGLPMDEVYFPEVQRLRKQGIMLAEVSCLASRVGCLSQRQMFQVFIQLAGLMFQSARANGIARILIAVHPRQVSMYERLLGFERFAAERAYGSVLGNPAVACQHDFASLDLTGYRAFEQVYSTVFSRSVLVRPPMPEEDRRYFANIAHECNSDLPVAA